MSLTVAFEGLPGTGKSTAIKAVKAELEKFEMSVIVIDLDSHRLAPTLRQIADDYPAGHPIRLLLLWALRLLQPELIQAMKNQVDLILLDRFWGTTLAYDVYGHRVPQDFLDWIGLDLNQWRPDVTLLFDAPLEVVKSRQVSMTLTDQQLAGRIRQGYLRLAKRWRWHKINATLTPAAIQQQCLEVILSKFEL